MLEKRFRSNGSVLCHWLGVGNKRGEISFTVNTVSATNSFLSIDSGAQWSKEISGIVKPVCSINVPVTTLDDFCSERSIECISFVKADIQDYEPQMLQGAGNLIDAQRIDFLKIELTFEELYAAISDYDAVRPLLGPNYRLWSFEHLNVRRATGKLLFCDAIFISDRQLKELKAQ
jgi:FkbM family methyltransferase